LHGRKRTAPGTTGPPAEKTTRAESTPNSPGRLRTAKDRAGRKTTEQLRKTGATGTARTRTRTTAPTGRTRCPTGCTRTNTTALAGPSPQPDESYSNVARINLTQPPCPGDATRARKRPGATTACCGRPATDWSFLGQPSGGAAPLNFGCGPPERELDRHAAPSAARSGTGVIPVQHRERGD